MDAINTVYGIYQNGQSVGFLSHDSFADFFKDVCIDLVCPVEDREYITDKVNLDVLYFEFGKFFSDLVHWKVQVDFNRVAFSCISQFFRNEVAWLIVELFNPNTVFVDLSFNVSVCRTAHSKTHRA